MTMRIKDILKNTGSRRALALGAMSTVVAGALVAEVLVAPVSPAKAQVPPAGQPTTQSAIQSFSFANIVDRVKPAVVSIRVKGEVAQPRGNFFDVVPELPEGSPLERFFREFGRPGGPNGGPGMGRGPQQRGGVVMSQGSGFIISPAGEIVTNYHVVKDATDVTVVMDDGTEYKAKVRGSDEKTDVALLKIEGNKTDFPTVPFAAGAPRVGDWVLAVGNPFGLGGTVTTGIVSARGRDIGAGPYDDFLQIDAPINRGNSGGPTFNLAGEVVGMNAAIYSPSGGSVGIGFAIPSQTIQQVISQLESHGEVVRGWLGVQIQPVTRDVADSLGLGDPRGALVTDPQSDSPAAKAGLKAGDVILQVEGRSIRNARDLQRTIAGFAPSSKVKLQVFNAGKTRDVEVTLGRYPTDRKAADASGGRNSNDDNGSATVMSALGLSVAPAKDTGAGNDGVVVVNVDPAGAAADRNVRVGDVILEVQGNKVATAADVRAAVDQARQSGRKSVLMRVKSGDGTRFLAVPIG
jgi:serine protease Do